MPLRQLSDFIGKFQKPFLFKLLLKVCPVQPQIRGLLAQTPQEFRNWPPYLSGMGEPIAVLALRRKRDQISGTIAHYERLMREAEHDLAHINAALRCRTERSSGSLPAREARATYARVVGRRLNFKLRQCRILFMVNRFTGSVTVCYASGECHRGPLPAAKPAS